MADEKVRKPRAKSPNPLAGSQIKSTVLDKTVKADVDLSKQLVDEVLGGSNIDYAALEKFTTISNAREQVYELIDTMGRDSAVAMLLKTFAGSVCEAADNGHIIWCEAKDPKVSKYVNYLLNIMNVDKYVYGWTYCLLKYGDVYLKLFRESDYEDDLFGQPKVKGARDILNEELDKETARAQGLDENIILSMHNNNDKYSYYVEMVPDPSTMFELTKYGKTYGFIEVPNTKDLGYDYSEVANAASGITIANYRMKSNDIIVHQADDYVHAYLDDNYTRFPETVQIYKNSTDYDADLNSMDYTVKRGKSILYDSYKTWREKTLLENAAILNRVTRSSIIRLVAVDVGDMSKEKAKATLRYVKGLIEQKTALVTGNSRTDGGMSEFINPGPTENNVYYTTHNGQGAITINAVGGDTEVKGIADIEWWNDKFYAAFGVPKQYFGFCLGKDTEILLLDGTTHTIEELYNNKGKYIGKGILGCNQDGSLSPTKISNIMLTNPNAELLRIWLDNGKYVDVTPDHRMMLRDGSFIPAAELKEGDSLMPYYDRIKDGRRLVLNNKTGKFEYLYQVVSAAKGEPIELGYNIHHKNKIKIDDDFDNLVKLSISDHCKEHNLDLATLHAARNTERRMAGEPVNANVGSRSITNGIYFTKLRAGEPMPDGFWYEGTPKSDETKAKMRDARLRVLADHPEYTNLGGFKAGKAKPETIKKMKLGQAAFRASLSTAELAARADISRQNLAKSRDKIKATKLANLEKTKPDAIKRSRKLRCPVCDAIFDKKLTNLEYTDYLQLKSLHFCCPEHRNSFDPGSKLARSYQLYLKAGTDEELYEYMRNHGDSRPDTYLKFETLAKKLDTLNAYVPEVNHKVTKIEALGGGNPVYDITVEGDCHTFALPAGIFVHNCDDGAGFNGGTALTIISSQFGKNVKMVQNAVIQAVTEAINLMLINNGLISYLNNFVLKMQQPITQEMLDYRKDLTDRINAISNMNSLFTDIEDRERRLKLLKYQLGSLNYGDEMQAIIDEEIEGIKAAKEAEKNAPAEGEEGAEAPNESASGTEDIELPPIPTNESLQLDGLEKKLDLLENSDEDLPKPEDIKGIDFTANN